MILQVEPSCQDPVEIILAIVNPVMSFKKNVTTLYKPVSVQISTSMSGLQTEVMHIPDPAIQAVHTPLVCTALSQLHYLVLCNSLLFITSCTCIGITTVCVIMIFLSNFSVWKLFVD